MPILGQLLRLFLASRFFFDRWPVRVPPRSPQAPPIPPPPWRLASKYLFSWPGGLLSCSLAIYSKCRAPRPCDVAADSDDVTSLGNGPTAVRRKLWNIAGTVGNEGHRCSEPRRTNGAKLARASLKRAQIQGGNKGSTSCCNPATLPAAPRYIATFYRETLDWLLREKKSFSIRITSEIFRRWNEYVWTL